MPYVSKDGFVGPFVKSLTKWLLSGNAQNIKLLFIGDDTQCGARNKACKVALEDGADYLWFLDSDQDFPVDALGRLMALDADIACADMWSRNWPSFRIVIRMSEPDETGKKIPTPVSQEVADAGLPAPIDVCGMGCTLIKVDLLRRMADYFPGQPWFWVAEHGEDATFCFKAADMKAKIMCDFGLKSGHWSYCRMMGQEFTKSLDSLGA